MNTSPCCPDCLQPVRCHCAHLECHWWTCGRCQLVFSYDLTRRSKR